MSSIYCYRELPITTPVPFVDDDSDGVDIGGATCWRRAADAAAANRRPLPLPLPPLAAAATRLAACAARTDAAADNSDGVNGSEFNPPNVA